MDKGAQIEAAKANYGNGMTAIAFTSARFKSMADGSMQATISIEPKDVMAYIKMFGEPGMPGALARIMQEAAKTQAQDEVIKTQDKEPPGQLCRWAVMRCQEPEFQEFLWKITSGKYSGVTSEVAAKNTICSMCNIASRRELDTNLDAAKIFMQAIMEPWQNSPMNPHREKQ